jgi:AcrR family transcriptional regulator
MDRDTTKQKLIQAVGKIIKEDGFKGLTVSKIARTANVDRKMIYRYFGGLNYLIEAYVVENDYWMAFSQKVKELIGQQPLTDIEGLITEILQNQFEFFFSEKEMQSLILWEISGDNPLMRSIHNARESMGQRFLELTDPDFSGTSVNFRAVSALLVGGIYYIILHTRYNGGRFSDMDIHSEEGRKEIIRTIKQIVGWAYQQAGLEKQEHDNK